MNFINFLNSGILFATLASIIPLLIHLFAKKKPKIIKFSSLRFLKEIETSKKKKINLKNLLILLLRILAILFFILAVAKPALNISFYNNKKHPPTAVAIVIDNSYSMNYLINTKTDFQIIKNEISKLNQILTNKDLHFIITRDPNWNKLNSGNKYGEISDEIIQKIKVSPQPLSINKLLEKADKKLDQSHFANKEIYFFTDLQKEDLNYVPQNSTYFIAPTHLKEKNNLTCSDIEIENSFLENKSAKTISFNLHNFSEIKQNNIVCRLIVNEKSVREKVFSLEAMRSKKFSFVYDFPQTGWYKGYIEVDDDYLEFDNKEFFAYYFNSNPKAAILTDLKKIPISLQSILEIYLKNSSDLFLTDDLREILDRKEEFTNIIVYSKNLSSEFVKNKLYNLEKILYILSNETIGSQISFLENKFEIKDFRQEKRSGVIDYLNPYNSLTKVFDERSNYNAISHYNFETKSNVLISSNQSPILVENNQNFLLTIPPEDLENSFWSEALSPLLTIRILENNSENFDSQTNIKLGEFITSDYKKVENLTTNKTQTLIGNRLHTKEPGIYRFPESSNTDYYAVNFSKEESQFSIFQNLPKKISILNKNWTDNILKVRYGLELYNIFLILSLLCLILEMLIIYLTRNNS